MLPVVLLSDKPQTPLLSRIAYALEQNLEDSFVLREHIGRNELCLERGILIMKDLKTPSRKINLGECVVPVTESVCRSAIRLLGRHGLSAVCCGMSPRDTLIAESISGNRGLLCLQRSIPTVFGEREPCELVAKINGDCDVSTLLLTAGALLAAGVDEERAIRI